MPDANGTMHPVRSRFLAELQKSTAAPLLSLGAGWRRENLEAR